jgi:hypothetical protein
MLTFLAVTAKTRFMVDHSSDQAMGYLQKNATGNMAMTPASYALKSNSATPQDRRPPISRGCMSRRTRDASWRIP